MFALSQKFGSYCVGNSRAILATALRNVGLGPNKSWFPKQPRNVAMPGPRKRRQYSDLQIGNSVTRAVSPADNSQVSVPPMSPWSKSSELSYGLVRGDLARKRPRRSQNTSCLQAP